jgi:ribosomal protein S11
MHEKKMGKKKHFSKSIAVTLTTTNNNLHITAATGILYEHLLFRLTSGMLKMKGVIKKTYIAHQRLARETVKRLNYLGVKEVFLRLKGSSRLRKTFIKTFLRYTAETSEEYKCKKIKIKSFSDYSN